MRVVADTSPLIALGRVESLPLLKDLYRTIWIPPAVHQELLRGSRRLGEPNPLRHAPWVRIARRPHQLSGMLLRVNLGSGESEALALAIESKSSLLLIDELPARSVAHTLGLRYTGTLGILLEAKARQLILEVRPLVERLMEQGFHISEALYHQFLDLAGE